MATNADIDAAVPANGTPNRALVAQVLKEILASATANPLIVVSSAAPSNSDGRADGTVYIQTP